MRAASDPAAGARNLLLDCAGLRPGDAPLIVAEDPALGWYDAAAPKMIAETARALGMAPTLLRVGAPSNRRDPRVEAAIAAHDTVIFLARIGDQDRFAPPAPERTRVMVYVRDIAQLGSAYGRMPHRAMIDLKQAINGALTGAGRVEITCPLGTHLSGATTQPAAGGDVGVRRFPLGVPVPVLAEGFSGRVALSRWLTPTGSGVYDPACLALDDVVFAEVTAGRIKGFSGPARVVAAVEAHYARIAAHFGTDGAAVHSWHPGMHPGCADHTPAPFNPDRWANTIFTSPRVLHFHTCAAYAPGEICWMVIDPTLSVDGEPLWRHGQLRPGAVANVARVVADWPALAAGFERPASAIGL